MVKFIIVTNLPTILRIESLFLALYTIVFLGGLVSKKPTDPLDAPPFVTGCLTLLKQYHAENTDIFLAFLGQYVRSLVDSLPGLVSAWVDNIEIHETC